MAPYQQLHRPAARQPAARTSAQQRGLEEQRETARLIEQGRAELARDIRGWSDTLAAALLETGVKQYGFDRAEIEEFTDPRMVKVLHDAHQFHILQGKQKQAQAVQAAQGVRPAARVGGSAAPPSGLDDRLSAEEWTRRREAQSASGGLVRLSWRDPSTSLRKATAGPPPPRTGEDWASLNHARREASPLSQTDL